jgi:tetratricopeptide (TPR) repeat protein
VLCRPQLIKEPLMSLRARLLILFSIAFLGLAAVVPGARASTSTTGQLQVTALSFSPASVDAINSLGNLLLHTGELEKARAHHAAALRLASEADSPLRQAHAHSGLARTYDTDGDPPQARHHWQEALTIYDAISAPEADEIRARLATVGDNGDDGHKPAEKDNIAIAPSSG